MRQLGFLALAAAMVLTVILLSQTTNSSRDTSDVECALVGHWLAENGDHIYYGPDQAVAVDAAGTKSYHPYRVLMCNEKEGWVKIRIANSEGDPVVRLIRFNEDRQSYQTAMVFQDGKGRTLEKMITTHYVDSQTTP